MGTRRVWMQCQVTHPVSGARISVHRSDIGGTRQALRQAISLKVEEAVPLLVTASRRAGCSARNQMRDDLMLVLEASARCGAMRGVSVDVIAPSHRGQLLDERKVSLLSPMHREGTDAMFHVKRDAEMCCAPEGVSQQRGRAGDMPAACSEGRVALRGRAYGSTGPRSTMGERPGCSAAAHQQLGCSELRASAASH